MWDLFGVARHFFVELIGAVRFLDLLDIAIVTFLFYRLLVLIRGTRSIQILVSLGFLLGVFVVAGQLQIRTVQSILGQIFDNLFIIFILLFQNDIRRALSQVGKANLLLGGDRLHESQLIEEIVKSCVSLSNKKIGALIVLERQADVLEFVEPGTLLDSVVSKELLTSIFLPVSPLHDGAVIVRKSRVHMAGCFLPLTLNPLTSKSIGTRHRAAVGLTEETDALCIVASEENGSLSLAANGRISHNLDAPQLRKMILEATGA